MTPVSTKPLVRAAPTCARDASGHAATAPPRAVMNSRRFIMRNFPPARPQIANSVRLDTSTFDGCAGSNDAVLTTGGWSVDGTTRKHLRKWYEFRLLSQYGRDLLGCGIFPHPRCAKCQRPA